MPFLPAFFTIISLGLQCYYDPEWTYSLYCDWDKVSMQRYANYWSEEIDSLPRPIREGLQRYETKLEGKLADYRNYCPPYDTTPMGGDRDPFVFRHFMPTFEGEIAMIVCPDQFNECRGWLYHGECLKPRCRENAVYKKISDGILMLHMGCFQTQNIPEWHNLTSLIERI